MRGEVEKIVGITRKTMDGYDEIKLLEPTAKNKNGYRLYDDDAIQKLLSIQTLAELGFRRQEIKSIFESEEADFDTLLEKLEEKKRQIEETMRFVEWMKGLTADLSEEEIQNFYQIGMKSIYLKKDFVGQFRKIRVGFKEYAVEHDADTKFVTQLILLGTFFEMKPDDAAIQMRVKRLYEYGIQAYAAQMEGYLFYKNGEEERHSFSELPTEVKESVVTELIEEMISDPEFIKELQENIAPPTVLCDMIEFIQRAIEIYQLSRKTVEP